MSIAIKPNDAVGSSLTKEANDATQTAKAKKDAQLHRVAGEFEAMLVRQLLTVAKIGGDKKQNGYADMAVDALATGVTKGGGLGLARQIEDVLSHAALHKGDPIHK